MHKHGEEVVFQWIYLLYSNLLFYFSSNTWNCQLKNIIKWIEWNKFDWKGHISDKINNLSNSLKELFSFEIMTVYLFDKVNLFPVNYSVFGPQISLKNHQNLKSNKFHNPFFKLKKNGEITLKVQCFCQWNKNHWWFVEYLLPSHNKQNHTRDHHQWDENFQSIIDHLKVVNNLSWRNNIE